MRDLNRRPARGAFGPEGAGGGREMVGQDVLTPGRHTCRYAHGCLPVEKN